MMESPMRTCLLAVLFTSLLSLNSAALYAEEPGTAGGSGTIDRLSPNNSDPEHVPFTPKFSVAIADSDKSTWIVLTDKKPPIDEWIKAGDPAEARRVWCEKEKGSFVALKLDSAMAVDLYFLCPGNGAVNTEMLSSVNGVDSIKVAFTNRGDKRLAGSLLSGEGSCPASNGTDAYCTKKSDYVFDAPLIHR
jgi:hypothetical protein